MRRKSVAARHPAAPEPFASRLRFYDAAGANELALRAGFEEVRLVTPDFDAYVRRAGIPEEAMDMYRGASGGWLPHCTKGKGRGDRCIVLNSAPGH